MSVLGRNNLSGHYISHSVVQDISLNLSQNSTVVMRQVIPNPNP